MYANFLTLKSMSLALWVSAPSVRGPDGWTCVPEVLLGTEQGLEYSNFILTFKSTNGTTGKCFNASLFTLC